jgi:signal recognition particle subunit SRP19
MAKVQGECILYPCYFNAGYSRMEGRRVKKKSGVKAPVITDLERALKRAGIPYRVEDHHHPAHWSRKEGRIVAGWTGGKEDLIRKVAERLEARK